MPTVKVNRPHRLHGALAANASQAFTMRTPRSLQPDPYAPEFFLFDIDILAFLAVDLAVAVVAQHIDLVLARREKCFTIEAAEIGIEVLGRRIGSTRPGIKARVQIALARIAAENQIALAHPLYAADAAAGHVDEDGIAEIGVGSVDDGGRIEERNENGLSVLQRTAQPDQQCVFRRCR